MDVVLSPKSHDQLVMVPDAKVVRSEKFTQSGAQPCSTSPANAGVGIGFTVTSTGELAVHPLASVTVAVYVVVASGVMFCV